MTPFDLKNFAYVWANIAKDDLENAGVVRKGQVGGSDWSRFNKDPIMFILKLPDDKLKLLSDLMTAKL